MFKISKYLKVFKNIAPPIKPISTTNLLYNENESPSISLNNYTPIYKFTYVRALGIVNRLKLYQAVSTGVALPGSLSLYEMDVISSETVLNTIGLGVTGCVTLFTVGMLANNFVGFVYLNKEENMVRLASVQFWGGRKDQEIPLEDIIPFSEVPVSVMDPLYIKFSRFSTTDILKINLKYGIVLDKEKYNKVFAKM